MNYPKLKIVREGWDFFEPTKRKITKTEMTGTRFSDNGPSVSLRGQVLMISEIERADPFQYGQDTEMYSAYMVGFAHDKEISRWSRLHV